MEGNGSKAVTIAAGKAPLALVPTTFDEVMRFANMAVKSGRIGKGMDDGEALAHAQMIILQGLELHISPMQALNGITLINGNPCIKAQLGRALVRRAGHRIEESMTGEGDDRTAHCKITRGDTGEVIETSFSVADAKQARLWSPEPKVERWNKFEKKKELKDNDSAWYRFPTRMMKHRAFGHCAYDACAEVMLGMSFAEIMEDEAHEEHRGEVRSVPDIPPPPEELTDDAAFVAEMTQVSPEEPDETQLDLEDAVTLEFVSQALVNFQCKASNATTSEEIEAAWEEFEAETDGKCPADLKHSAEISYETQMARLG